MAKEFKPSKTFLQKVANGGVMNVFGYSAKTGGHSYFVGGEKTYEAHRKAGYVNTCHGASLGRPAVVTLTEKGRAALQSN
jgi:hypothetical protein